MLDAEGDTQNLKDKKTKKMTTQPTAAEEQENSLAGPVTYCISRRHIFKNIYLV